MTDNQFYTVTGVFGFAVAFLVFTCLSLQSNTEVNAKLAGSTQVVDGNLRDEYMKACVPFLKNDATEPCRCMFEAHSIGGSETIKIIIPYYQGEYGPMEALMRSAKLGSPETTKEIQDSLSQCPSSWTPDKGWH